MEKLPFTLRGYFKATLERRRALHLQVLAMKRTSGYHVTDAGAWRARPALVNRTATQLIPTHDHPTTQQAVQVRDVMSQQNHVHIAKEVREHDTPEVSRV